MKINLIFVSLFFLFSLSSKVSANNIAYIDIDLVLQNSSFGKKIFKKLEEEKKIKLNEIKKRENDIKNKDSSINTKKNILSKKELETELISLSNDIENFNIYKKKIYDQYEETKNQEILNFFKEIEPHIQEYLGKNSIDILFNNKNIIIGKDNLDITEKIIKIIDKKIK